VPTEQNLLVRWGIEVIELTLPCDDSIQLFDHQAERVKFVTVVGSIHENVLLNEEATDVKVSHVVGDANER
jgi:hypothetical protein